MKEFIGKKVKIIFEDGDKHYSRKIGFVLSVTEIMMTLKTNTRTEAINQNKIIRIEQMED